ncbi:hypothetical protein FKM82_006606 [Ascaphus truei]
MAVWDMVRGLAWLCASGVANCVCTACWKYACSVVYRCAVYMIPLGRRVHAYGYASICMCMRLHGDIDTS